MLQSVALLAERRNPEMAPFGRHVGRFAAFDDRLFPQPVGDDIGYGDDLQIILAGDLQQLRHPGHRAVLIHDLDQCAGRLKPCHAGQIDRRLRVSRPAQHPFLAGPQGVDVSRTPQVARPGRRIGQRIERCGAVVDRNARGTVVSQQIDRNREGGTQQ